MRVNPEVGCGDNFCGSYIGDCCPRVRRGLLGSVGYVRGDVGLCWGSANLSTKFIPTKIR